MVFATIRAIICRVAAASLIYCRTVSFSDLPLTVGSVSDHDLQVFDFAGSNSFSPVELFEEIIIDISFLSSKTSAVLFVPTGTYKKKSVVGSD